VRPRSDVDEAFRLLAAGHSQAEVARRVGIGRATVGRWAREGHAAVLAASDRRASGDCPTACDRRLAAPPAAYAYLLGQYLGDGTLAHVHRGVHRLFVTCCTDYPGIIDEVCTAIRAVMPGNALGRNPKPGCVDITCYSTHWPCLLPQHGPGHKHTRPIALEPWQSAIALDQHPGPFVRGLVHSDGCRTVNRIRKPRAEYEYVRYMFSNRSDDIRALFATACDRLGVESRPMGRYGVSVARRSSVEVLETIVGPKR
jgi:hypothetical protein